MSTPKDLMYAKSHEWLKLEGQEAVIGITEFAQEQLGDLTFVDLPKVGTQLKAGQEFGSVESVKAASEVYAPVAGTVIAVNEALNNAPELINSAPYSDGWMIRVKVEAAPQGLLSAAEYEATAKDH